MRNWTGDIFNLWINLNIAYLFTLTDFIISFALIPTIMVSLPITLKTTYFSILLVSIFQLS